jgi:dTDP-4-amino-4,6-dideoxygalactose transaminase
MIPIFRPSIKRKDMDAVLTCLVSDSIGHGQVAKRFAAEVSDYVGTSAGVAFREYSRAINTVFDLLELRAGDKVALSPLSPSLYLDVMVSRGLIPLYVDVDARSGCMSPAEIEKAKAQGPSVLLIASPIGFIAEMPAIAELEIPIVEDISTALGGTLGTRKCGTFGTYSILRLEEEDIITAGGGALVLSVGKKEQVALKKAAEALPPTCFLPDMNAALGSMQIAAVEQFILRRRDIAQIYSQALAKSKHKTLFQSGESDNTWFSFPVFLEGGVKEIVQYARRKGVETISAFQDTITARMDFTDLPFPNARALSLRCLLFPLYPTLGKQNITTVSKVLSTLP